MDRQTIDDEICLRHDRPGLLSLVNRSSNKNGSQFYITGSSINWLDGFQVVFGKFHRCSTMTTPKNYTLQEK